MTTTKLPSIETLGLAAYAELVNDLAFEWVMHCYGEEPSSDGHRMALLRELLNSQASDLISPPTELEAQRLLAAVLKARANQSLAKSLAKGEQERRFQRELLLRR